MSSAITTTHGSDVDTIANQDLEQFVTFTVNNQLFGVAVLRVQDILQTEKIASIPLAPPAVRGSINLRGRIVTVIDVRVRLGLDPIDHITNKQMGVTVELGPDLYTLLVDSIGDVISLPRDRREKTPGTLNPQWKEFSSGVFRLDGRIMVVLDIDRILDIGNEPPLRGEQQRIAS